MSEPIKATPLGAMLTPQLIEALRKKFPRKGLNPNTSTNELWLREGECQLVDKLQETLDAYSKKEQLDKVLN